MKKRIAILALFAAAMGATASSWAFQSVGRSTMTAGVTTLGVKTATATVVIRDVSDPLGSPNRSTVTWSGVTPPATGWKVADRCLVVIATVTDEGGGVQIYTRNTEGDASPQFVDPTPGDKTNSDSAAAGLVKGTAGTTSTPPLPMAWSIKDSTSSVPVATDPNAGTPNAFQWLFFKDRYNTANIPALNFVAFADGQPFVTMINVGGLHFGQADTEFAVNPDGTRMFVYMQANFTQASAQQAYQTSTLTVESYIQ